MSILHILIVLLSLIPSPVVAREPSTSRYMYPNASIFAWANGACPNGSASIHDPVYVEAGRLSGVSYCIFPSPDIAVAPNAFCPAGFKRNSANRCIDQREKP